MALIIAAVMGSVVWVLPAILLEFAQPNIVLTETEVIEGVCFDDYRFNFTLVNTGGNDGFANVQFLIDGTVRGNSNYFVPAGSSVDKSNSVLVDDCVQHTGSIRIASTWRA